MNTETRRNIEVGLKPCPFCGGKPYLESGFRAFIGGETTKVTFIRCVSCNARSQRFPNADLGTRGAIEKASAAWNLRFDE